MAVTVERYFTVCHPFYRVSHSWSAKMYIVPIVSFAVVYNIPKFFELYAVFNGFESFRRAFIYLYNDRDADVVWGRDQSRDAVQTFLRNETGLSK